MGNVPIVADVAPIESVLCTQELSRRPPRPPDYQKENRALVALAKALSESPRKILQTLADTIVETLGVGSAGVSLLTLTDDGEKFYWPAIAGDWTAYIGGGTPREVLAAMCWTATRRCCSTIRSGDISTWSRPSPLSRRLCWCRFTSRTKRLEPSGRSRTVPHSNLTGKINGF